MTRLNTRLTREQALPKIRHFCAYQERSHKEVRDKLYTYGLYRQDVEQVLTQLIEEDYLNEERFAIQYAGGKFRMKQWGRVRITMGLKEKSISPFCIKIGLGAIEEPDYLKTLEQLAIKKWTLLKGEPAISRDGKTRNYLLQKGYEPALIQKAIEKIKNG